MNKKDAQKSQRLDFYTHEYHKWKRAVNRRICITLPVIALTLLSAHKKDPIPTIESACVSAFGIRCIYRANFYRRRAAYRLRQEKRSLATV